ncbi:MAG: hypothetical protein ABI625_28390 [bacterium]
MPTLLIHPDTLAPADAQFRQLAEALHDVVALSDAHCMSAR